MNLKKLTQAVFDGLPKEYRWAAYDITGDCYAYKIKPKQDYGVSQWDVVDRANNAKMMGEWHLDVDEETGYWLHSLIERQDVPSVGCTGNPVDVPTAADIDWSQQEVPAGATHYAIQDGVITWLKDDNSFWNVWQDNAWMACGLPVAQPLPTKPAPQVDWSKAPEGATHYNTSSGAFFKRLDNGLVQVFAKTAGEWASLGAYTVFDLESSTYTIKRPESITDVARSIEAVRVAEKSGNRCATCTANICSVIDDCYVRRAKEESARIEEQACMPWPDGDPRYFETSDCCESLAVKVCADQPAAQVIDPPVLGNQSGRDAVNNPAHYTTGGIECIDAMQAMLSREEFIGYLRGNIFKYQWRYKHKNGVEDLRKADWYAQRLIRVEGEK